jgi:hypothetical protein
VIEAVYARLVAPLAAVLSVVGAMVPAARAEPFLTRNQSPLLALYGLPSPLPARLPAAGGGRFAAAVNWSNAAKVDSTGGATYTLDAEVFELRLHFDHAINERYAVHVELPWRQVSGGSLDSVIEDWHSVLGLPGGSRRRLPEDQLLIEYKQGDATVLRIEDSSSGIGDIPIALGYQLFATDQSALATWLTAKAPVGNVDDLTGSGAADVAATLAGLTRLNEHWQIFGQATVAWLGEGDLLPEMQQSFAWTLMGGLTWNAWRSLDVTAQVEANSKIFDGTDTEFDGDAIVLTVGGSWRTAGGWRWDFAVSEDLQTGASPDVAFNLAVSRNYQ